MYKIENTYTNYKGITFDGLRTIHVNCVKDIPQGEELVYTEIDELDYYHDGESRTNDGVMINRSLLDRKKAFRVYKDWPDAWHYKKSDDELVYNLQKKQSNIKLTQFPTGIVVVDSLPADVLKNGIPKVIGQEIYYYDGYTSIDNFFKKNPSVNPIKAYIEILTVLKELLNNGIYYKDIHVGNFVVDKNGKNIKIIDFEPGYVQIDRLDSYDLKETLRLFKMLILRLNEYSIYKLKPDKCNNLYEIEEYLHDEFKKIKH